MSTPTEGSTEVSEDFSILDELNRRTQEETRKLVAQLIPVQYSQHVGDKVRGLETREIQNGDLQSIRYVFDDQVLEVTSVHIWLQLLGQRHPALIADLSHPDSILVFRKLVDELNQQGPKE